MTRNWSDYQQNIFSFIEQGHGNALIEAVAGSGKSTTIIEGMNRVPATQSTIFLAFNKTIADELKGRGVNARTFHSLTYSPVLKSRGAATVDADKLRKLIDANYTGDQRRLYGSFITRLVGLAKQVGVGCLLPDTYQTWLDIVILHDLETDNEEADLDTGIKLSMGLLDHSNASPMVDFDDMLYLAVKDGIKLPTFAVVFVDEAQDTNAIQRAILRKIMGPRSRIIAVGDPAQAIYGFRGADSNSLNLIANEFNCERLPLTVTYRCPTAVVKYAQQWVSHIEAAPGAPEGIVMHMGNDWRVSDFKAGDLVVCRTTRPLIALGFKMLRNRVPVRILGREIGQGLVKLCQKMKVQTVDQLLEKLAQYEERELEKARAKGDEAKMDRIADQCSAIRCIADGMDDGQHAVADLTAVIDKLFTSTGAATVLSTIHKAKGLEADTVFWLNRSQCPSKWARQPWQQQQEANLCYVATTRAKTALVTIEEKE